MEKGLINKAVSGILLAEEWPEYRLVIPADEPVSRQVRHLRMQWESLYGKETVSEKPPSVTLACFTAREEMEETLMRWIQRICDQQRAFQVILNNISALPSQTIYIRVQDEKPFSRIARQLRGLEDFMKDKRFFEKPFIKLGSMPADTPAGDFILYTHQLFHAAFMARKLILSRKEKDGWRVISNFPFRQKDEQDEISGSDNK